MHAPSHALSTMHPSNSFIASVLHARARSTLTISFNHNMHVFNTTIHLRLCDWYQYKRDLCGGDIMRLDNMSRSCFTRMFSSTYSNCIWPVKNNKTLNRHTTPIPLCVFLLRKTYTTSPLLSGGLLYEIIGARIQTRATSSSYNSCPKNLMHAHHHHTSFSNAHTRMHARILEVQLVGAVA